MHGNGHLLKSARHRVRVSQTSLAALASVSQSFVSRVESGEREISDPELDRLLAMLGARRSGGNRLDPIMRPLDEEGLRWWRHDLPLLERLRSASMHCEALGRPLAGMTWPQLLGVLRLVAATNAESLGCAVGGSVARARMSPDLTRDADCDWLDLVAVPGHASHLLPHRLPSRRIRVRQVAPAFVASAWPAFSGREWLCRLPFLPHDGLQGCRSPGREGSRP